MSTNWPLVKLRDVLRRQVRPVEVVAEDTYREIGIRSHGKGLFHKEPINGLTLGEKRVFWLKTGDFVLNIVFAWEGAVGLVGPSETGMIGSHRFPTFQADKERLDARFLLAYFRTPKGLDHLGRVSPGGAGRNRTLSQTAFLEIEIPLPPLAEQRRLVARIEAVAALVAKAQALRKEAVLEAEALVNAARNKLFTLTGHDEVVFGELVATMENGWSPACEARPAEPNEWGVVKLGAVSFGVFDPRENKALPPSLQPKLNYELKEGDFLMSRANTAELVGACAIVPRVRSRLMLCDKIFRIVFKDDAPERAQWIDHALKSPILREQISRAASGTSPTMKNISKAKILSLRLPKHDLPTQRRIVRELDALQAQVDALKALQAETQAELDGLLGAVLAEVFGH